MARKAVARDESEIDDTVGNADDSTNDTLSTAQEKPDEQSDVSDSDKRKALEAEMEAAQLAFAEAQNRQQAAYRALTDHIQRTAQTDSTTHADNVRAYVASQRKLRAEQAERQAKLDVFLKGAGT